MVTSGNQLFGQLSSVLPAQQVLMVRREGVESVSFDQLPLRKIFLCSACQLCMSCCLVERVVMCAWLHVSVRLYSFIVRRVDLFLKVLYFGISPSSACNFVSVGGAQVPSWCTRVIRRSSAPTVGQAFKLPPAATIVRRQAASPSLF